MMQRLFQLSHAVFFFLLGAFLTALILTLATYLFLTARFQNRAYPGVKIAGQDVSAKTFSDIKQSLSSEKLNQLTFQLYVSDPNNQASQSATISASAKELGLRLDSSLMASRALSTGRQTKNPYYNLLQIISAFQGQINLPLEIKLDHGPLDQKINAISPKIEKPPVNATFQFLPDVGPDGKGRVETFFPSQNGISIDRDKISQEIISQTKQYLSTNDARGPELAEGRSANDAKQMTNILVPLYTKSVPPDITSSTADQMGIKDLLGEGISYFYDSIPNRVYNLHLGTQKVTGRLVAPAEIFSFNESIGTVSALFGFQKAYSIIKGKTVLDDGGGVCQVSTTLYRAVLNAGLPVVERVAHAYRVGFYEEGGFLPGLDATVYPPSPDFRFKNDTGNWLLIQANFDESKSKLTFDIFGTNDGRKSQIIGPVILSTSPPPDPTYDDDPTKPAGSVTQIDTPHWGAKVYFKRQVSRNGEMLTNETVSSDFIPWPARFLRGTKI